MPVLSLSKRPDMVGVAHPTVTIEPEKLQGFNPQTLAGHTSEAMTDRYIRLREIPQVEGPKLARILDNR